MQPPFFLSRDERRLGQCRLADTHWVLISISASTLRMHWNWPSGLKSEEGRPCMLWGRAFSLGSLLRIRSALRPQIGRCCWLFDFLNVAGRLAASATASNSLKAFRPAESEVLVVECVPASKACRSISTFIIRIPKASISYGSLNLIINYGLTKEAVGVPLLIDTGSDRRSKERRRRRCSPKS